MSNFTDYGRPMKPFSLKSRTWAWADKCWGIFGQTIGTHFGAVSPLSMFSIIQPLCLQKTKPNIYLGLGFELGQQRIRDLALVCP